MTKEEKISAVEKLKEAISTVHKAFYEGVFAIFGGDDSATAIDFCTQARKGYHDESLSEFLQEIADSMALAKPNMVTVRRGKRR